MSMHMARWQALPAQATPMKTAVLEAPSMHNRSSSSDSVPKRRKVMARRFGQLLIAFREATNQNARQTWRAAHACLP